nr:zinc-binding dehydrogenase [Bradyrhizobium pachyrhizi]
MPVSWVRSSSHAQADLRYRFHLARRARLSRRARFSSRLLTNVWPLLADGRVKPLVYKTFPLKEAVKAHALMESSEHIGKIVLTISDATAPSSKAYSVGSKITFLFLPASHIGCPSSAESGTMLRGRRQHRSGV